MQAVLVVLLAKAALVYGAGLHPVFDHRSDYYSQDLKSCLSADLAEHELATCRFFAITIDAGSTGTRLHLFELSHEVGKESALFKVEREIFREVKPGLSSFADSPAQAAASVADLLTTAKKAVPQHLWGHTPLALKATAGLRLLPEDQAEAILEAVANTVTASPFLVNEDSVVVMSGTDEGVFGWFTLNVLLERMGAVTEFSSCADKAAPDNATAAALDLGGGSTQITFRPLEDKTFVDLPADYEHSLSVFGTSVRLYTHSYLGNGLVASRLGMLKLHAASTNISLVTDCLPEGYNIEDWDYAGDRWIISGSKDYGSAKCLSSALKYVQQSKIRPVEELLRRDVFAFSYFFDRGLQAGLVRDTDGGATTVGAFREAALKACQRPKTAMGPEHWRPWQCLDLSYIYALLHDGYRLPDNKVITLAKKMRQMEVSWALGASYHLLNTYHEQRHAALLSNATSDASSVMSNVFAYFCSRATTVLSYLDLLA
uniref:Uncharacterized protein n=1 Tax=Plectus sambesii TaxID=2011161 RepID=A0A914UNQ6_9BILA